MEKSVVGRDIHISMRTVYVRAFSLVLFLFLFSNLLTRIAGVNFNLVFYFLWISLVGLVLATQRWNAVYFAAVLLVIFLSVYPLIFGEGPIVGAAALKDLGIPVSAVILGVAIGNDRRMINSLNRMFFPFVAYGLIQAIIFYSGNLNSYLPWDYEYVQQAQASGVSNLFQEDLLRFFGTMNAFWEYQLLVVLIPLYVWTQIRLVRKRKLLYANTSMALLFLAVTVERTPLLLLAFLIGSMVVLNGGRRMKMVVLVTGMLGAAAALPILFDVVPTENADAVQRLKNVITLNFQNDESLMGRLEIWAEGVQLIRISPVAGVGPELVLPALEGSNRPHFSPHNGYIFLVLGFGITGALAYLAFFLWLLVRVFLRSHAKNAFAVSVAVGFLVIAVFHIPWVGRLGEFCFLILGFALSGLRTSGIATLTRVGTIRSGLHAV